MLPSTTQIFKSALAADPSVSVGERNRLLKLLRDAPEAEKTPTATPEVRLLRRAEVARRLSVSLRAVDVYAAQGILQRVHLPGRTRAAGFLSSAVDAIIRGKDAA